MAKEVTVLGAGIVGICTALSLLERGFAVRLIDRGEPGQETSYGNAGIISPWSIVPQSLPGMWKKLPTLMFGKHGALSVRPSTWPAMIPWGLAFLRNGREAKVAEISCAMDVLCGPSIDLYRRHLQGTGAEHLVRDSYYVHAFADRSKADLDSIDYRIRREKGADIVLVERSELLRLEPALNPAFEAAVLIKGQARAVSPGRIASVLAGKVQKLGGTVLREEITALSQAPGGWSVECGSERYFSPKIVLALGAWSDALLKPLGLKLPLMAERGYHVEFPNSNIEVNHSIMDMEGKVVASSVEGGLRVAGQAEFGPVDAPPDERKKRKLDRLARSMFPNLETGEPRFWMGRRPSFPDSLPAIGELPGLPGLVLNFGHSHYGLMMAPKSGEIAADILNGTIPNVPLTAMSPMRFGRSPQTWL